MSWTSSISGYGDAESERSGDSKRSAALAGLARARIDDDPEQAAELARKAVESGRAEGDPHATAIGMLVLSHACHAAGHADEDVLRSVTFAIEQLTTLGDSGKLAEARLLQATLFLSQCAYDEAELEVRSASQLATALGDRHLSALCDVRLASIVAESNSGDRAECRRLFATAASTLLELGDRYNSARALFNLAANCLESEPSAAASSSARALALLDDETSALAAALHFCRAEAAARLGWFAVADAEVADIEQIASVRPLLPGDAVEFLTVKAVVHRANGRLDQADVAGRTAVQRATELGDEYFLIHANRELAEVCERRGDLVGALSALRASHDAFVRLRDEQVKRRRMMFDLAGRIAAERRESANDRAAQIELERTVESACEDLAHAEEELVLERSRRTLLELRATTSPGAEPSSGLPSLETISGAVATLIESGQRVAVVIVTVDDDRIAAPLPDDRQRLLHELSARTHAFMEGIDGAVAGSMGSDDIIGVLPIADDSDVHAILSGFHRQLVRPIDLANRVVSVAVQLGIALAPEHGIRATALLSRARLAAQAARQERRTARRWRYSKLQRRSARSFGRSYTNGSVVLSRRNRSRCTSSRRSPRRQERRRAPRRSCGGLIRNEVRSHPACSFRLLKRPATSCSLAATSSCAPVVRLQVGHSLTAWQLR
jgi:hypothetical protein